MARLRGSTRVASRLVQRPRAYDVQRGVIRLAVFRSNMILFGTAIAQAALPLIPLWTLVLLQMI